MGLGKAIARLFFAQGATVVLNSHRNDEHAAAILQELSAQDDQRVMFVQAEVADAQARQSLVDQTVARFGSVDVLINNAGMDMFTDPMHTTAEQWQHCFDVDLNGAWHTIRAVLPTMLANGYGNIVNIASVHGHKIIPGCFPYPVAKHALIGLTRSLGIEYAARGIRVNSISPGLIMTDAIESKVSKLPDPEGWVKHQADLLPCKRIGRPEEVAYTALFLASDEARFINAADILIDGGRSQLYHE